MTRSKESRIGALALPLAALMLVGCGTTSAPAEVDVSTAVPDEEITLSFVYFDDPPATQLVEAFTDEHPNVTIDSQHIPFSDYVTSIKLSMDSDESPDLVQYNAAAMRPLIRAGLVRNLDPWAEEYGWEEKFPESSLRMLTSDDEASTYGVGSLYAAPAGTKFVGLYYNTEILEDAGVNEAPETLDELDAALEAVTVAGHRGLSVGGLDTGLVHLWAALQNAFNDPADFEAWVFGQQGATIDTEGPAAATDLLADWASAGYLAEGVSAVSDTDALAEFTSGESAFMFTGNWAATEMTDALGDSVGFVPAPVAEAGDDPSATAGSLAYAISSQSENANTAAAFLDFMSTQEAAETQVAAGLMPSGLDAEVSAEGLGGDVLNAYDEVINGAGILAFPDFATTGMLDKLKAGLQGVSVGNTSTPEFLATLQEEWDDFHG